jgi:hypothetical protein
MTRKRKVPQAEFDLGFAEKMLRERGRFSPLMIFRSPDGVRILAAAWRNADEKLAYCRIARAACVAWNAHSFTLVTEAWGRRLSRRAGETVADVIERARAVPVSQAEDRFEILGLWRSERVRGQVRHSRVTREVQRDDTGAISGLAPTGFDEPDSESTRWFEILPVREATPAERHGAAMVLKMLGVERAPDHVH